MKKLFSILLSTLFIVATIFPGLCLAIAETSYESPENPTRYTLTSSISAALSISGGTARASGNISAKYSSAYCTIKVQLQKKGSDGAWHAVKTWTNSGTWSTSAGGNVSVSSGSYRTCVLATVTYNGSTEYTNKYSATKTC